MSNFESQKLKQSVALSAIAVLGLFILFSLSNFIPAFLGSIIFYIICAPLMNYLHVKKNMAKWIAALLIILLTFLVILVPIFSFTNMLINKITEILSNNTEVFFSIHDADKYLEDYFGVSVLTPENIELAQAKVAKAIPNMLNHTFTIVAELVIMYFVLFFMLSTEMHIKAQVLEFFPFKKENANLFVKELSSQTYSNVVGAPLLAIIQGLFAYLGFSIFGVEEPGFWAIMCGFLSFIPFIGTALVWIPAGMLLLSVEGNETWQGVGLLIYGGAIITNVDNVFRFVIQKKMANIHPLVTVFGVILGLNWFGLPGLIFGPILISYFLIMLKIYHLEYGNSNILTEEK